MATTNNDRNPIPSSKSLNVETLKSHLTAIPLFLLLYLHSLLYYLRDFLLDVGFSSFPTLAVIGEPGTGKTPTVTAIVRPDDTVDLFKTPKKFENRLYECTGTILVDDFMDANSPAECQRIKTNYDVSVRLAFKGAVPPLVMTMESKALRFLNASGKDRVIPQFIGTGIGSSKYADELKYFQRNPDLDQLSELFKNELPEILPSVNEYHELLDNYRTTYKDIAANSKRLDMCFSLYLAYILLNKAVARHYGTPLLNDAQLQDTNHYALTAAFKCNGSECSVVESVLETLLLHRLQVRMPIPMETCEEFARNGCADCRKGSSPFCCYADHECDERQIIIYNPEDMVYRYDEDAQPTILLTDPERIYQYNRPYSTPTILIIDSATLTDKMNAELSMRAAKTGESIVYFTNQKLHQNLAALNRCLMVPNGRTYRYSLDYPCYTRNGYDTTRIIALLLKPNEAQYLSQNALPCKHIPLTWECTPDSVRIAQTLKKTFSSLTSKAGAVGVESNNSQSIPTKEVPVYDY